MLKSKERRIELDIARTIAIMCVMLCHSVEMVFLLDKSNWLSLDAFSKIFSIFLFTIGRLGVPLFLFLTGTLILNKDFTKKEVVSNFIKKNVLSLIIVNSIWVIIYNAFFLINNQTNLVSLEYIFEEIILMKTVPLPNMWYFPMIIRMYLLLPLVAIIIRKITKKQLIGITIIIYIAKFVLPMVSIVIDINTMTSILSPLGIEYLLYILVGYLLDKQNNKKRNKSILVLTTLLCYLITCLFQIASYSLESMSIMCYNVWYDFPLLIICAACIFKLLLSINTIKINKKVSKVITFISKTSLSSFFLHIIIQKELSSYINAYSFSATTKTIMLFSTSFIICLVLNSLFCKIRIISKYVMLVKN